MTKKEKTEATAKELFWKHGFKKVSIDEIVKRNYNLDIKNPNTVQVDELDPEEVLADYRAKQAEVKDILEKIKKELTEALSHHDR